MEIPATKLATRIAEVYSDIMPLKTKTVAQLATALHEGRGAVRQGRHLFVVLAPPFGQLHDSPAFIAGRIHKDVSDYQVIQVKSVSAFFRERAKEAIKPRNMQATWLPVATPTAAIVPMSGHLDGPIATTNRVKPRATYEWYDLQAVPIGGIVCRLDARKALYVFQRINANQWMQFLLKDAIGTIDLLAILADLQAKYGPIDGLLRDPGCAKLALLHKPLFK